MSALNPKNQKNVHTAGKIKSLARKHTKVVENIRSYDGQNKLFEEIDRYVTDDDVEEINNDVNFESFWIAVSGLLDGAWQRYEVLSRFALALGTRYDATSDVERSFSVMNYIHQNSQRNRMGQEMLNANLHIRSAVEHNKETIKSCDKCQSDIIYREHCHCSLFTITHSLRERCKIAYRLEEQAAKEKQSLNNNNLVDDEEMKNKKEAFEKEEIERKEKEGKSEENGGGGGSRKQQKG